MSINGNVKLIYGTSIKLGDLDFNIYDEEYEDLINGNPDNELQIVDSDDGHNTLYVGVVLASWDKYDGVERVTLDIDKIKLNHEDMILQWLEGNHLHWSDYSSEYKKLKLIYCVVFG